MNRELANWKWEGGVGQHTTMVSEVVWHVERGVLMGGKMDCGVVVVILVLCSIHTGLRIWQKFS